MPHVGRHFFFSQCFNSLVLGKKSITLLLLFGFDLCEGQRALNWSRVRLRSIASPPTPLSIPFHPLFEGVPIPSGAIAIDWLWGGATRRICPFVYWLCHARGECVCLSVEVFIVFSGGAALWIADRVSPLFSRSSSCINPISEPLCLAVVELLEPRCAL